MFHTNSDAALDPHPAYGSRPRSVLCLFWTIAIAIAAFHGNAYAQEYYGVPIDDGGVAFLLDVSGSMEGRSEKAGGVAGSAMQRLAGMARNTRIGRTRAGQAVIDRALSETTKMGAARRALMRALGSLRDGTSFTVVTFGSEATEWPGGERPAGNASTIFAQGYVATLSAAGDTPMAEALTLGFASPNVRTLFVVSDGRPTTGEVLGLARQLQAGRRGGPMVINTVGIGQDQDPELLCRLATENGGVYVRDGEVACSSSPCPADHGLVTFYPPGPKHHYYEKRTVVCSTTGNPQCTPQLVYETMISEARFQAPTRERTRVTNCQKLDLRIFDWIGARGFDSVLKFFKQGSDPVTLVVDPDQMTASNYTRPGHEFHPGKVTRRIRQDGDLVIVETIGTGIGGQKTVNEEVGPVIFGSIDVDLVEAVATRLTGTRRVPR